MGPGSAAHHAASGALRSIRGTRPRPIDPNLAAIHCPPSGKTRSIWEDANDAGAKSRALAMAVDTKGNVYTGEVDTGKRIQKFRLTSDALR